MKKTIIFEYSTKVVFFMVGNGLSGSGFAKLTNDEKLNFLGKLPDGEKRVYDLSDPIGMNAFLLDYNQHMIDPEIWYAGTIE